MQTPSEDVSWKLSQAGNQRSEVQNPSSAANLLGVHGQVLALINISLLKTKITTIYWVCIISVNPANGLTNNPGAILHFTDEKTNSLNDLPKAPYQIAKQGCESRSIGLTSYIILVLVGRCFQN